MANAYTQPDGTKWRYKTADENPCSCGNSECDNNVVVLKANQTITMYSPDGKQPITDDRLREVLDELWSVPQIPHGFVGIRDDKAAIAILRSLIEEARNG